MTPPTALTAARQLVLTERHAVLSTAHAAHRGWPFGSLVPFALLPTFDPVLFLAEIAEHTHNIATDARVSLLVADAAAAARPQAGARICLLARAREAKGSEREAAANAYFTRFPEAASMRDAHGFALYVLAVERVRWIGGFGSMGWFERGEWSAPAES